MGVARERKRENKNTNENKIVKQVHAIVVIKAILTIYKSNNNKYNLMFK